MKKPQYNEAPALNKFVVVADYQPAYMDNPPDTRPTRHKTIESTIDKVDEHKAAGACSIEVMKSIMRWQVKG